uniref:PAS domain-containing protein n=1 Tax=Coccolithus braarudii TaxID=221442 RepID=A0A7S0LAM6_9EUKA|mmetsp:Transcript_26699/g.57652  ORF Transcript_26699/g.57652 Transcript_26699/m.57652 type:complete len:290 (+) Transcript_26699:34-903(+)|eukprot:CAMPEP_0183345272 /NCGR_PEP_ID=MMETSP0164_2-20130417/10755_1 /TAXON_ID=221442 /ORGANISM="Coccolithus pelagicus ssp braarudi, Strain PLY182g" /LENGTH=289 /DNA_ID=CAMNT_0025516403 /DNA_START=13 /DNA_END=882 /DNA_ORIENTATION=-
MAGALHDGEPLSLEHALKLTDEPRILTTPQHPFTIIHTNKAWSELTGHKFAEVAGKAPSFLQGIETSKAALAVLHAGLKHGHRVTVKLVNYKKNGEAFTNTLTCAPVGSKRKEATHLFGALKAAKTPATAPREPASPAAGTEDRPSSSQSSAKAEKNAGERGCSRMRHSRTLEHPQLKEVLNRTSEAIVITQKDAPYSIIHTNQAWCDMCGYTAEEVEGLTNSILSGPDTDPELLEELMSSVRRREPTVQTLVNYKKDGTRFINQVKVQPVYNEDDEVAAFMALLHEVE